MSQGKQIPLDGVHHHEPSIPPQQVHDGPHRRCSLLSALIEFIVMFITVSLIIAFSLSTILRSSKPQVYVEKASLTQFNLTNGANLQYNLTVEVSVSNPKRRIGVQYERLEARAYYDVQRFGYLLLPPFYQEKENTTTLHPVFDGQSLMVSPGDHGVQFFNREKNGRVFSIDVVLYSRIWFEVGYYRTRYYNSEFKCHLRVPLVANESLGNCFTRTECDVDIC